MEHAQRDCFHGGVQQVGRVLILILMEHAQRAAVEGRKRVRLVGLNPYFNGTCSKRTG